MSALRRLAAAAVVLASVQTAQAMDYSYRLSQDHRLVIVANGYILEDEHTRLLHFSETLSPALHVDFAAGKALITFDSPGGRMDGSIALGNLIAIYRLATSVVAGGQCASGCVIAWASGARKSVGPRSHIGVHSATNRRADLSPTEIAVSSLDATIQGGQWLLDHGAPDKVVNKALNTPPSGMYWLTDADLAAWGVAR